METPGGNHRRLLALSERAGERRRVLSIGTWEVALEGLDGPLADSLDRRWGGFVQARPAEAPRITVRILEAGEDVWLEGWGAGERYSVEGEILKGGLLVRSYHFGMGPEGAGSSSWRLGIVRSDREPRDRVIENAARYLIARLAAADGGFAIHGAAVLRGAKAYVFAGHSGSGKTTAVGLSAPSTSLGDDFAALLPGEGGWQVPAVPFDNLERAPETPPRGLFPAAGVWRLYQASEPSRERPATARAVASLLGCVAFPQAMPDLSRTVIDNVQRFVTESEFGHLRFRKSPDFWSLIET